MIGRSGERGSRISVLAAQYDDDIYIYINLCVYIYIYICVCVCVYDLVWLENDHNMDFSFFQKFVFPLSDYP